MSAQDDHSIYHQYNGNRPHCHHSFTLVLAHVTGIPDLTYKVIAVTANMVTILIISPQPNGQATEFNSQSLRTLDQSVNERVPAASADTGASGS